MEQRRAKRFTLHLPLAVTRTGTERVVHHGRTRNISSSGVLFATAQVLAPGPIEYTVTLVDVDRQLVNIRCVGKVVRFERASEEDAFYVAATLERYEFVRQETAV